MVFLQIALNGDRQHPNAPRSADAIAADAARVVSAGAQSVHVHAYDDEGRETLRDEPCARLLRAIRRECTSAPISLTTSAAIEATSEHRLVSIKAWTVLPDLVTANQGEEGIVELSEYLMSRGIGIEAGLLSASDARRFGDWPGRHHCARVLIEPLDADPAEAVAHAAAMEQIVRDAGVELEQVHHGDGIASWAVNRRALASGHGIRTGLEDTPVMPDGSVAEDNLALVRAAARMIDAAER